MQVRKRWKPSVLSLVLVLPLAFALGCSGSDDGDSDKKHLDRMAEEHQGEKPTASAAAGKKGKAQRSKNVFGKDVVYANIDDQEITGYLARPKQKAEGRPAVVLIHEWWGLNDNIRAMADRLAEEGYIALAVDLYGGEVAENPDRARELATAAGKDRAAARRNLTRAYSYLERRQKVSKVGSMGWCFGGGWSLNMALMLPDKLDAAVIYYGRLVTDKEKLAALEAPVLGLFGAEDKGIPVASVREFEAALKELGKESQIHVYEGAGHAFANPSGQRYEEESAEDAWAKTVAFLDANLKG